MKIPASQLLTDLSDLTKNNLQTLADFKNLPDAALNWRATDGSWSILECLEHLNLYGDYYLPEMAQRIAAAEKTQAPATFRSGLIGNYFAKMMLPQQKGGKMKTFKDKNPLGSTLTRRVLDRFESQQRQLLHLLEQARQVNLSRVKTSISISTLLKLRLGDTFRVVIYHNYRHLVQARRVLAQQQKQAQSIG